jgi:HD-like signal output (HDOD) protein
MEGKILIVEDNEGQVEAFRKLFLASGVQVYAAATAAEGLEVLSEETIDVVLTHFRMQQGDGLQFLKQVREKYPGVYRILSSGFLDDSMAFRFVSSGLVSAYIAKPWNPELVRGKIAHTLVVKRTLQEKKLLELISSIKELPSLPGLFQELLEAMEGRKSMQDIAAVIKKDPAVAAKVIHVVNSAFFGREDIAEIEEAAVYLGVGVLKDIVLTAYFIDRKRWSPGQITYLKDIFLHSYLVNKYIPIIFKTLFGQALGKGEASLGIVHDIGKIILLQHFPERFQAIAEKADSGSFYQQELALGYEGCTHAEIGAFFLDWWNLPSLMVETALFHHTPDRTQANGRQRTLFKLLHYTDRLVIHVWDHRSEPALDMSQFYIKNIDGSVIHQIGAELQAHAKSCEDLFDRLI